MGCGCPTASATNGNSTYSISNGGASRFRADNHYACRVPVARIMVTYISLKCIAGRWCVRKKISSVEALTRAGDEAKAHHQLHHASYTLTFQCIVMVYTGWFITSACRHIFRVHTDHDMLCHSPRLEFTNLATFSVDSLGGFICYNCVRLTHRNWVDFIRIGSRRCKQKSSTSIISFNLFSDRC